MTLLEVLLFSLLAFVVVLGIFSMGLMLWDKPKLFADEDADEIADKNRELPRGRR